MGINLPTKHLHHAGLHLPPLHTRMSQFMLRISQDRGGEADRNLHESVAKESRGFVSHSSQPVMGGDPLALSHQLHSLGADE